MSMCARGRFLAEKCPGARFLLATGHVQSTIVDSSRKRSRGKVRCWLARQAFQKFSSSSTVDLFVFVPSWLSPTCCGGGGGWAYTWRFVPFKTASIPVFHHLSHSGVGPENSPFLCNTNPWFFVSRVRALHFSLACS